MFYFDTTIARIPPIEVQITKQSIVVQGVHTGAVAEDHIEDAVGVAINETKRCLGE